MYSYCTITRQEAVNTAMLHSLHLLQKVRTLELILKLYNKQIIHSKLINILNSYQRYLTYATMQSRIANFDPGVLAYLLLIQTVWHWKFMTNYHYVYMMHYVNITSFTISELQNINTVVRVGPSHIHRQYVLVQNT